MNPPSLVDSTAARIDATRCAAGNACVQALAFAAGRWQAHAADAASMLLHPDAGRT